MSTFITIEDHKVDFPHDSVAAATCDLKATRDRLVECAARMGYDFSHRSASGHAYNRVGEYAACRMGTEMCGVTVIVRPSQIEIVAQRRAATPNGSVLQRSARSWARRGVESMRSVIDEAVRVFRTVQEASCLR